jgi:hypothetical protein
MAFLTSGGESSSVIVLSIFISVNKNLIYREKERRGREGGEGRGGGERERIKTVPPFIESILSSTLCKCPSVF